MFNLYFVFVFVLNIKFDGYICDDYIYDDYIFLLELLIMFELCFIIVEVKVVLKSLDINEVMGLDGILVWLFRVMVVEIVLFFRIGVKL